MSLHKLHAYAICNTGQIIFIKKSIRRQMFGIFEQRGSRRRSAPSRRPERAERHTGAHHADISSIPRSREVSAPLSFADCSRTCRVLAAMTCLLCRRRRPALGRRQARKPKASSAGLERVTDSIFMACCPCFLPLLHNTGADW